MDRRGQKKYAGSLLDKPQLLLNPWAVRSTETAEQVAREGEMFRAGGRNAPSAATPGLATSDKSDAAMKAALSATSGVDVGRVCRSGVFWPTRRRC